MEIIRNKKKMYEHLRAGRFGNTVQQWHSIDDFERDGYPGLVALRSMRPGCLCIYDLQPGELRQHLHKYPDGYNISPMTDYRHVIFQGEVMRDAYGYRMFMSTCPKPMRQALKESGFQVDGIRVLSWLRTHFWSSSYEDMMAVLDCYPDHVVEFTCCDRSVGVIPHRNVIIWEVRKY